MLRELFQQQVNRTPDAAAVICEDRLLTFRELNRRAGRLARQLQNLGVGSNVLVGICVERSLEMVVGLLGILKAGGAYVPLDPAYPRERLIFMLQDAQPSVLVTQTALHECLPPFRANLIYLEETNTDEVGVDPYPVDVVNCQPNDLAYILYTSGSTGKPKGVRISNRALFNCLSSMQVEPGIEATDTLLAVTTLSFDIAGLELFLPLISGARLVIAPRQIAADGSRLSSLVISSGATMMQATPITWRLLLAAGWRGNPNLKILCGGESWSKDLADELLPCCRSLWNMYGPTETTIWSSVARVEAGKPILIGSPIANTTFRVFDPFPETVPDGAPGELYIGGDGVAEGYLNRPELTAERFVDDPFAATPGAKLYRTGDIVRRLPGGEFEFLHRSDEQLKIRGFRIEPGEIESALRRHPSIAECAVDIREVQPGDQRLVAWVVPSGVSPNASELRDLLKQTLPDYMIPSVVVALHALPLTPNNKIDRKALPVSDPLPATAAVAQQTISPRTLIEIELTGIWEKVLGRRIASLHDSFFDLGGHSLLALQMFTQIEQALGVHLPLAVLYDSPSIADLARTLSQRPISRWSTLVPIQPAGTRPPFFCFHGEGGNVLIYRKLAQYLGPGQPFYGLQSQRLDGDSSSMKTIGEMAALYLKEIRRVQPHGPYFLGGYCMGGTIAYEAAQQLHDAGEEVALLALLDTMNWRIPLSAWDKATMHIERLIFHAVALLNADRASRLNFLRGKLYDLKRRIPVWEGTIQHRLKRGLSQKQSNSGIQARIWLNNHKAALGYLPKPYPGTVTDFRPSRQYRALNKSEMKWDRLAKGGQRVMVVPGYPAMMLLEPYVGELATLLAGCIDDGIRRRARVSSGIPT
jgi:amino acid adenylation domain-containing protein